MRLARGEEDQDKTCVVPEEHETLLSARYGLETGVTIGEKALGPLFLTDYKDCEELG